MIYYNDENERLLHIDAEPWQVELLDLNPGYCSWGNGNDCMTEKRGGWTRSLSFPTWEKGRIALDDLNEIVNFYFFIDRKSETCPSCGGSGLAPETNRLAQTFYGGWESDLHEDEVLALAKAGRISLGKPWRFDEERGMWKVLEQGEWHYSHEAPELPTPEEVNEQVRFHDAVNHFICVRARAERLGFDYHCDSCQGKGYHYSEEPAYVGLQLWVLHPRKGAARGWKIERIERDELPDVFALLKEAAERNARRFSGIP